jgi:S-adenosylmethionine:tRNA ribosyltransferase-isomerase
MRDQKLEELKIPNNLIANTPAIPRDSAKLLVYNRATKEIIDDYFFNLTKYIVKDSSLVFNQTKVDKVRLLFKSINNRNLEVFILKKQDDYTCWALVKPGKFFKLGSTVNCLDSPVNIEVLGINDLGHRLLKFNFKLDSAELKLFKHIPLPPYIPQNDSLASQYQTVFSKKSGSLAAPTAGLHFTKELLTKLESNNHSNIFINLNVGLGTFANLSDENFQNQKLHQEEYFITKSAAKKINSARHITAIGTTSLRTLESANKNGLVKSGHASTELFITQGYKFKTVDSLITNFHLPGTSLLYLVSAFLGSTEELLNIYNHAISNNYRFYSFGDGMLII